MRCLKRNQQTFWYSAYGGITAVEDENHNLTGEHTVTRSNPVKATGNISPARGEAVNREFGDSLNYDRVIVVEDPGFPIDEQTVLWIGITPSLTNQGALELDQNGDPVTPWNYVVRRVAPSLNSMSIAVSKVSVR